MCADFKYEPIFLHTLGILVICFFDIGNRIIAKLQIHLLMIYARFLGHQLLSDAIRLIISVHLQKDTNVLGQVLSFPVSTIFLHNLKHLAINVDFCVSISSLSYCDDVS